MANDVTSNPWSLDTVDAVNLLLDPGAVTVRVDHIEFVDYPLNTDNCQLVDRNGKVVWECDGEDDLSPVRSGKIGWVNGLKLTVLTAGKVRVYV